MAARRAGAAAGAAGDWVPRHRSPDGYAIRVRAFLQGLKEAGYVDGQNVQIEYRWANGRYNRLPALAAELVQRQVAVLVAGGVTPTAMAAKAATTAIPVVFAVAVDPVKVGLVASLVHPGGNLTGVTDLDVAVGPKRLELLRDLLPKATSAAVLINPANPTLADAFVQALEPAGRTLGLQVNIVRASTDQEIDAAFANLVQLRADGVIIMPDVFFNTRSVQLAALALRNKVPELSVSSVRGGWRPDELRQRSVGILSAGRDVCRENSQG